MSMVAAEQLIGHAQDLAGVQEYFRTLAHPNPFLASWRGLYHRALHTIITAFRRTSEVLAANTWYVVLFGYLWTCLLCCCCTFCVCYSGKIEYVPVEEKPEAPRYSELPPPLTAGMDPSLQLSLPSLYQGDQMQQQARIMETLAMLEQLKPPADPSGGVDLQKMAQWQAMVNALKLEQIKQLNAVNPYAGLEQILEKKNDLSQNRSRDIAYL